MSYLADDEVHAADDTLLEDNFLAANPEINVFHITLADSCHKK